MTDPFPSQIPTPTRENGNFLRQLRYSDDFSAEEPVVNVDPPSEPHFSPSQELNEDEFIHPGGNGFPQQDNRLPMFLRENSEPPYPPLDGLVPHLVERDYQGYSPQDEARIVQQIAISPPFDPMGQYYPPRYDRRSRPYEFQQQQQQQQDHEAGNFIEPLPEPPPSGEFQNHYLENQQHDLYPPPPEHFHQYHHRYPPPDHHGHHVRMMPPPVEPVSPLYSPHHREYYSQQQPPPPTSVVGQVVDPRGSSGGGGHRSGLRKPKGRNSNTNGNANGGGPVSGGGAGAGGNRSTDGSHHPRLKGGYAAAAASGDVNGITNAVQGLSLQQQQQGESKKKNQTWAKIASQGQNRNEQHSPNLAHPKKQPFPTSEKKKIYRRDKEPRSNSNKSPGGGGSASSTSPLHQSSSLEDDTSELCDASDFDCNPKQARFFVIKSYTEDDVQKSMKYKVWASTDAGNKRLQSAFLESEGKFPIYLFFSVNRSGKFCGMAQMMSPLDFEKKESHWSLDKWNGSFSVKWIFIKDIQNNGLKHIRLQNNENKPVTHSRDTQEIPFAQGKQMLKILANAKNTSQVLQRNELKREKDTSPKGSK